MPAVVQARSREVALETEAREPKISMQDKIASLGLEGVLVQCRDSGANCTAIDLSDNRIGDAGARVVADVLGNSEHTLRLNLARCAIGPDGCTALAQMLTSESQALESLILSGNDVGQGALPAQLCEAVADSTKLVALQLSNCGLTRERLHPLCVELRSKPAVLRRLNLSYNDLDALAASDLGDVLKSKQASNLEYLELSMNNLQAKGAELIVDGLRKAGGGNMKRLLLDRNNLQIRGCEAVVRYWTLPEAANLEHVDIRDNHVSHEGCKKLMDLINGHRGDNSARRVLLPWPEKQGSVAPGRSGDSINIFWEDSGLETRRAMPQKLFVAARSDVVGEAGCGGREVGCPTSQRGPISAAPPAPQR